MFKVGNRFGALHRNNQGPARKIAAQDRIAAMLDNGDTWCRMVKLREFQFNIGPLPFA